METFKIPVDWTMYGYIDIEAETLEEAVEIFDNNEHVYELPDGQYYVNGSFCRDQDIENIRSIND